MSQGLSGPPESPVGGPPTGVPTCYRHPGRETYIRCTRCNRSICPECMTSASVGFQCPECVSQGRRSQPTPRTATGGTLHGYAGRVTNILIAINVVVYVISMSVPGFTERFGLIGQALPFSGANHLIGVADGQSYRLFTSMFLHASLLHIGFNMWALYVVGRELEAVLGRSRYIALYVLSGLGGSALAYLLSPANVVTVGASGAIFGLFSAMFVVGRRLRADVRGIAAVIGVNLAITFAFRTEISWQAHVGGLVVGAVMAAAYAYAPRNSRVAVQVAVGAVIVAAIVGVVMFRTAQLTGMA